MQKSGIFVVYRVTGEANPLENVKQTLEYYARIDSRGSSRADGDTTSANLADAVQMDKQMAFREAIRRGGNWAAGEVISDKTGTRVEQ